MQNYTEFNQNIKFVSHYLEKLETLKSFKDINILRFCEELTIPAVLNNSFHMFFKKICNSDDLKYIDIDANTLIELIASSLMTQPQYIQNSFLDKYQASLEKAVYGARYLHDESAEKYIECLFKFNKAILNSLSFDGTSSKDSQYKIINQIILLFSFSKNQYNLLVSDYLNIDLLNSFGKKIHDALAQLENTKLVLLQKEYCREGRAEMGRYFKDPEISRLMYGIFGYTSIEALDKDCILYINKGNNIFLEKFLWINKFNIQDVKRKYNYDIHEILEIYGDFINPYSLLGRNDGLILDEASTSETIDSALQLSQWYVCSFDDQTMAYAFQSIYLSEYIHDLTSQEIDALLNKLNIDKNNIKHFSEFTLLACVNAIRGNFKEFANGYKHIINRFFEINKEVLITGFKALLQLLNKNNGIIMRKQDNHSLFGYTRVEYNDFFEYSSKEAERVMRNISELFSCIVNYVVKYQEKYSVKLDKIILDSLCKYIKEFMKAHLVNPDIDILIKHMRLYLTDKLYKYSNRQPGVDTKLGVMKQILTEDWNFQIEDVNNIIRYLINSETYKNQDSPKGYISRGTTYKYKLSKPKFKRQDVLSYELPFRDMKSWYKDDPHFNERMIIYAQLFFKEINSLSKKALEKQELEQYINFIPEIVVLTTQNPDKDYVDAIVKRIVEENKDAKSLADLSEYDQSVMYAISLRNKVSRELLMEHINFFNLELLRKNSKLDEKSKTYCKLLFDGNE